MGADDGRGSEKKFRTGPDRQFLPETVTERRIGFLVPAIGGGGDGGVESSAILEIAGIRLRRTAGEPGQGADNRRNASLNSAPAESGTVLGQFRGCLQRSAGAGNLTLPLRFRDFRPVMRNGGCGCCSQQKKDAGPEAEERLCRKTVECPLPPGESRCNKKKYLIHTHHRSLDQRLP